MSRCVNPRFEEVMSLSELIVNAPSSFAGILLSDFLRYFLGVSLIYILVWHLFAKRLAHRKILPDPPKPGQKLREFKHSMVTVLVFAAAAPVTRLFRVTPVLSLGQTLSEANSVAGVSNSYSAHKD